MERNKTQLESMEEIQAVARGGSDRPRVQTQLETSVENDNRAEKYKPTVRPSMAVVTVLFDGLDRGERIAVRTDKCVVGRSDCDINVSHDVQMSGKHFELVRPSKTGARWRVRDLDSTNGTYGRISDALLSNELEFLIGSRRFRFLDVDSAIEANEQPAEQRNVTQKWAIPAELDLAPKVPAVVEITPSGESDKIKIEEDEVFIGSDQAACAIHVDDRFVDPIHAKIYRDEHGRWHLVNQKSTNGTWVKIDDITIEKTAQIQAGEQRFSIWVS